MQRLSSPGDERQSDALDCQLDAADDEHQPIVDHAGDAAQVLRIAAANLPSPAPSAELASSSTTSSVSIVSRRDSGTLIIEMQPLQAAATRAAASESAVATGEAAGAHDNTEAAAAAPIANVDDGDVEQQHNSSAVEQRAPPRRLDERPPRRRTASAYRLFSRSSHRRDAYDDDDDRYDRRRRSNGGDPRPRRRPNSPSSGASATIAFSSDMLRSTTAIVGGSAESLRRYLHVQAIHCRAMARVYYAKAQWWRRTYNVLNVINILLGSATGITSLAARDTGAHAYLAASFGFLVAVTAGFNTAFMLMRHDTGYEEAGDGYNALAERIDAELATADERRLRKLVVRHRADRKQLDAKFDAPSERDVFGAEMRIRRQLSTLNRMSIELAAATTVTTTTAAAAAVDASSGPGALA